RYRPCSCYLATSAAGAALLTRDLVSIYAPFRQPPSSPLFPYTTLFRSQPHIGLRQQVRRAEAVIGQQARLAGVHRGGVESRAPRSEEHTSELQSRFEIVCRLLLAKKKRFPFRSLIAKCPQSGFPQTYWIVPSDSSRRRSLITIAAPWPIRQSRSISPNRSPPWRDRPSVGCRVRIWTGPRERTCSLPETMWCRFW